MKYPEPEQNDDGWTDKIFPNPTEPYRMQCCDCGLVHDLEFGVETTDLRPHGPGNWVWLRVRRNNRSTAAVRRNRKDTP